MSSVGSPRAVAQDIRENAAALTNPEEGAAALQQSAMPTSALLSRDPGLIALEQGARTKAPVDFIQRDQNVKAAAAERVEAMRDPAENISTTSGRVQGFDRGFDRGQGSTEDLCRLPPRYS